MRSLGFVCLITAGVSAIVFHWRPELAQHPTWTEWSKDLPGDLSFPGLDGHYRRNTHRSFATPTSLATRRRNRTSRSHQLPKTTHSTTETSCEDQHRERPFLPLKWTKTNPPLNLLHPIPSWIQIGVKRSSTQWGSFRPGKVFHCFSTKAMASPLRWSLNGCTPGRTRRALDQLGKFLKRVPTPPRVTILFPKLRSGQCALVQNGVGLSQPTYWTQRRTHGRSARSRGPLFPRI